MKPIQIIIFITLLFLLPQQLYAQQKEEKVRTYTFKDGSLYEGNMKWGRPNGDGYVKYVNGDTYKD